jgi:two-component system, OmpR family, response regulator NblR
MSNNSQLMITNSSIPTIFFLDTDPFWTQGIILELQPLGYRCAIENSLSRAREKLKTTNPVAIVIDRQATGKAGIEFCQEFRRLGNRQPILMLIEKGTVEERVICLDAGADDYLIAPFHRGEFLQTLRTYLQTIEVNEDRISFGDLTLDLNTHQILRKDKTIDLTTKEFDLLKYLILNPERVLSREDIIENVWGYDYRGESNVIEVYIRYLRLKLEAEGHKRLIQTVRGVGYVLRD